MEKSNINSRNFLKVNIQTNVEEKLIAITITDFVGVERVALFKSRSKYRYASLYCLYGMRCKRSFDLEITVRVSD